MIKLMSALKIFTHNIQVLHRNVIGENWFIDHQTFEGYYQKLSNITDDVIEIAMTMNLGEPSLDKALTFYNSLGGMRITSEDSFQRIQKMFLELIELFEEVKADLKPDVVSKFEEYQYWLRKEASYKIARRLDTI